MKLVRQLHLYLGCLLAPALIFFAASGAWQTFYLHRSRKDGSYTAPAILDKLSNVHMGQRFSSDYASSSFQWFAALMAFAVVLTSLLGIVMALKYSPRPWTVWACLLAGVVLPMSFLFLG